VNRVRALLLAWILAGCGGSGSGGGDPLPPPPPAPVSGEISLLFFGNSHTSANGLTEMAGAMVRAARPGRTVRVVEAQTWMFLDERATDAASLDLLRSRQWTFVVLQAQKYSSSGLFDYPITGAVALVRAARAQGATPILFPEWPRSGIAETQRIFDLHVSIARAEPACVPPIPQAFDAALARYPQLTLHAADGNHSAPAGAFLAALVIATTMTGTPPTQLPFLAEFPVDGSQQALLRGVAAETTAAIPPRQYCPLDPPLP
jgi:hypothetical protein